MNQENTSKKRWTRWVLASALVLLIAGLGFLVGGGPEWMAVSIIRGQLQQIGITDVEIKGLKLSFSGDFQISTLQARGRIEAASAVVESISLEIQDIRGRVNWSDLWAGSPSYLVEELQPPAVYFPLFIPIISFQDTNIILEMQDGRRLLAEGLKAGIEHPDPESLAVEVELKKFSINDEWMVKDTDLKMSVEGKSVQVEEGKARFPEGNLLFAGTSDALYALMDEVNSAANILNNTEENWMVRAATVQSVFHRSGTEISGSFVPDSKPGKIRIPDSIDFSADQEIPFQIKSASDGLNAKVEAKTVELDWQENHFVFHDPLFIVDSHGVSLSAEPVAEKIGDEDTPLVPIFLFNRFQ